MKNLFLNEIVYILFQLKHSLIGGHNNDSRFRRNIGESSPKEHDDLTSNVPFWAMLLIEGSQGSQDRIIDSIFFYYHEVKGLNLILSTIVAAARMRRAV